MLRVRQASNRSHRELKLVGNGLCAMGEIGDIGGMSLEISEELLARQSSLSRMNSTKIDRTTPSMKTNINRALRHHPKLMVTVFNSV